MPNFYDAHNRPVRLGQQIASPGGEGTVFEVRGRSGQVAKIYHPSKAPDVAKLRCMIDDASERLVQLAAWPLETLHDGFGMGPLAGFLMPRISKAQDLHELYGIEARRKHFPGADWRFLVDAALNCASAFEEVHRCGFLVGDVNQKNILVRKDASIVLVDCDSFQVRSPSGKVFRCGVGVEEFTPPELQPHGWTNSDRKENHDRFGLAVTIFYLLMMGRHPYGGARPLPDAIRGHQFAYTRNARNARSSPPPGAPTLDMLSFSLAVLFERAFAPDAESAGRPTAYEWRLALGEFRGQLGPCSKSLTHYYHPISNRCPWCQLEAKYQVVCFGERPKSKPKSKPKTKTGKQLNVRALAWGLLCCGVMLTPPLAAWLMIDGLSRLMASQGSAAGPPPAQVVVQAAPPRESNELPPLQTTSEPSMLPGEEIDDLSAVWDSPELMMRGMKALRRKGRVAIPDLIEASVHENEGVRNYAHILLKEIEPYYLSSPEAKRCVPRLIEIWRDSSNPDITHLVAGIHLYAIEPNWQERLKRRNTF